MSACLWLIACWEAAGVVLSLRAGRPAVSAAATVVIGAFIVTVLVLAALRLS